MTERFNIFFDRLLGYEGGFGNHQDDHGGVTKYGISKKSYPDLDIANLTLEQVKQIYWDDYYKTLKIDEFINDRIAWQVFDFGVNAGIGKSAKLLQRILKVTMDGKIGNITLGKANSWYGKYPLYIHFISQRLKYYMKIIDNNSTQMEFLKGWIFRAVEIPYDL